MSAGEKFRTLSGAAQSAGERADAAMAAASAALTYNRVLVAHLGLEVVTEPAEPGRVRVRYRRRLPRWLAWVRRVGICR